MAQESDARAFLETPAATVALSPGARLGPYEINAFLGAGPSTGEGGALTLAVGTMPGPYEVVGALGAGGMGGRYLPSGHLAYARAGRPEAVPFDPVRLALTGAPGGLIPDVMQAVNSGSAFVNSGAAQFTTSSTGTLVYVSGGVVPDRLNELVWVDRTGSLVETLLIPPGPCSAPKLSPDGRRILYVTMGLSGSLWCYDLARRTPMLIPTREPQPWYPIWAPDGQRAVFAAPPGRYSRLHVVPVDGRSVSTELAGELPETASEYPGSWTPDGRTLVYSRETDDGVSLWQYRIASAAPPRAPSYFRNPRWPENSA